MKAFCDVTVEAVKANDKVTLPGFGTFDLTVRAEREGINPSTKEKMIIHKSKSIHYKMASGLKNEL